MNKPYEQPKLIDIATLPSIDLSDRKHLPGVSAVYFVIEEGVVIYVGASENLLRRWRSHNKLEQLEGRPGQIKIAWLECPAASIVTTIEDAMIKLFQPELNLYGSTRPEVVNARYLYGEKKQRVQIMLTKTASEMLDRLAEEAGVTRSEYLEQWIRRELLHGKVSQGAIAASSFVPRRAIPYEFLYEY